MRVIINGWFWDRPETGSGQYVRRLTSGLASIDPTIDIQVVVPAWSQRVQTIDKIDQALSLIHYPAKRTNLGKLRWEQVTMPQLARRVHADLLHIPYWAPPLAPPGPEVVTVHDIIPLILPAYRGGVSVRLYTALVSAATAHAQIVITDSEASQADILQHLSIAASRVRVVPLAVGQEYGETDPREDREIRSALQLPQTYVLYLGGFDVRKNLQGALRTFAIVHRACTDTKLVVAGRLPATDSDFSPDPRRLARESGIPEDAMLFLGFVPESEKRVLYREARVFLCPSLYEGFGYTALEALASGTPVVGSEAASLPEVVGDAGVLLPPRDAEGMAGAVIQLLVDDAFYADLQARARRQSRKFSWDRTARETLAAYHDALR